MARGLSLILGVAVLSVGLFWAYKLRNIQRLKGEIVQLETKLNKGQEVWSHYPPLSPAEKRDLQKAQERLFHMLPKDKEIPSLLQEIALLAQVHNLTDVSFSAGNGASPPAGIPPPAPASAPPQGVVSKPSSAGAPAVAESSRAIETVPIKVGFAGDYREIAYFLEALGKLPRLVTMQSVKVQRSFPLLQAEVVVHAYYQKGELTGAGK